MLFKVRDRAISLLIQNHLNHERFFKVLTVISVVASLYVLTVFGDGEDNLWDDRIKCFLYKKKITFDLRSIYSNEEQHHNFPERIHTIHHHHVKKQTIIKKIEVPVIKEIKVPYNVYVPYKVPYTFHVPAHVVKVPIEYFYTRTEEHDDHGDEMKHSHDTEHAEVGIEMAHDQWNISFHAKYVYHITKIDCEGLINISWVKRFVENKENLGRNNVSAFEVFEITFHCFHQD